jgi:hypothetical protein
MGLLPGASSPRGWTGERTRRPPWLAGSARGQLRARQWRQTARFATTPQTPGAALFPKAGTYTRPPAPPRCAACARSRPLAFGLFRRRRSNSPRSRGTAWWGCARMAPGAHRLLEGYKGSPVMVRRRSIRTPPQPLLVRTAQPFVAAGRGGSETPAGRPPARTRALAGSCLAPPRAIPSPQAGPVGTPYFGNGCWLELRARGSFYSGARRGCCSRGGAPAARLVPAGGRAARLGQYGAAVLGFSAKQGVPARAPRGWVASGGGVALGCLGSRGVEHTCGVG